MRNRGDHMPRELEDLDDITVGDAPIDDDEDDDDEDDEDDHHFGGNGEAVVPYDSSDSSRIREGTGEGRFGGDSASGKKTGVDSDVPRSRIQEEILKLPKEIRNIVAGGLAGMIAKSFVAPVDRIKILYQVSNVDFHLRNVPQVARNIIQNEGSTALWKGNTATLLRIFPYSGIQFMVFDSVKTYFLLEHEKDRRLLADSTPQQCRSSTANSSRARRKWGLTPIESLVAGMIAGAVSVICTYPLDLTRAQMAVTKRQRQQSNPSFVSVLQSTYRRRGFSGLWRGLAITVTGILPYSGIAFAMNEQGRREIQHLTGQEVTTVQKMQCGAVAGLVAQSVTYPIEVTRRRMQTIGLVESDTALNSLANGSIANSSSSSSSVPQMGRPPSLRDTVKALYAEQGVKGFFKGVSINWVKGPLAFSISFTCFDVIQALMESDTERALRLPRRLTFRRERESK